MEKRPTVLYHPIEGRRANVLGKDHLVPTYKSCDVSKVQKPQTQMKLQNLLLFALISLVLSCNEADDDSLSTCFESDPVAELSWLADKIDDIGTGELAEYFYVVRAQYGFETIFIFSNCCPFCNSVASVYDCNGEAIGYIGDGTFGFEVMEDAKLVWKPVNSKCAF